MSEHFKARNRTARAAVVGNPASARLDASVANCFPGLELDVRNLDGRFFPGLLFRVVTAPAAPVPEALPNQAGIRLAYVDYQNDPMLPERSDVPTRMREPLAKVRLLALSCVAGTAARIAGSRLS